MRSLSLRLVAIGYLLAILVGPLAIIFYRTFEDGFDAAWNALTQPDTIHAFKLTLIITSDRGLCGPYNGSVLRTAMAHARNTPGVREGEIELVGRKGAAFLKFNNVPVTKLHALGDKPT